MQFGIVGDQITCWEWLNWGNLVVIIFIRIHFTGLYYMTLGISGAPEFFTWIYSKTTVSDFCFPSAYDK